MSQFLKTVSGMGCLTSRWPRVRWKCENPYKTWWKQHFRTTFLIFVGKWPPGSALGGRPILGFPGMGCPGESRSFFCARAWPCGGPSFRKVYMDSAGQGPRTTVYLITGPGKREILIKPGKTCISLWKVCFCWILMDFWPPPAGNFF